MPRGTEALVDAKRSSRLQGVVELAGGDHHQCRSKWACVYTQPQAERWANANLTRLGYVTYLPMVSVLKRDKVVRSMQHSVLVPLFARYLFVVFDHTLESWSPIRACPGVVDLVRSGGVPDYARAGAVEALRALEGARCGSGAAERWPPCGAAVGVSGGVLRNCHGMVTEVAEEMAAIVVMMLGQLRTVWVPIAHLEPWVE